MGGSSRKHVHSRRGEVGDLKQLYSGSNRRAKGSLPKKAQRLKKGKTLTLGSNLAVVEGGGGDSDEVADE